MPPYEPPGVYLYVQVRIGGLTAPMLVPRMLQQLPTGTRTFLLRKYSRCFSGTDLVCYFISKRLARDEREALALGNALLRAGVFRHVRNEHLFRSGNYFYRFAAHEDYALEDESVNLRSSRMMNIACNSFLNMPEIRRVDTVSPGSARNMTAGTNFSDATFFSSEDEFMNDERPEFDLADITVETGIRIGRRAFPNLVSDFTNSKDLVGTNAVNGRILEKSFTGRSATKWLVRHRYAKSTAESISIGNAMLSAGIFYPLESDHGGFECNDSHYRMLADTDITKELKRGARKDMMLKMLGVNRSRAAKAVAAQQSPWFEDQMSFSFATSSTVSR